MIRTILSHTYATYVLRKHHALLNQWIISYSFYLLIQTNFTINNWYTNSWTTQHVNQSCIQATLTDFAFFPTKIKPDTPGSGRSVWKPDNSSIFVVILCPDIDNWQAIPQSADTAEVVFGIEIWTLTLLIGRLALIPWKYGGDGNAPKLLVVTGGLLTKREI